MGNMHLNIGKCKVMVINGTGTEQCHISVNNGTEFEQVQVFKHVGKMTTEDSDGGTRDYRRRVGLATMAFNIRFGKVFTTKEIDLLLKFAFYCENITPTGWNVGFPQGQT